VEQGAQEAQTVQLDIARSRRKLIIARFAAILVICYQLDCFGSTNKPPWQHLHATQWLTLALAADLFFSLVVSILIALVVAERSVLVLFLHVLFFVHFLFV
jgi:hypothetical protein